MEMPNHWNLCSDRLIVRIEQFSGHHSYSSYNIQSRAISSTYIFSEFTQSRFHSYLGIHTTYMQRTGCAIILNTHTNIQSITQMEISIDPYLLTFYNIFSFLFDFFLLFSLLTNIVNYSRSICSQVSSATGSTPIYLTPSSFRGLDVQLNPIGLLTYILLSYILNISVNSPILTY